MSYLSRVSDRSSRAQVPLGRAVHISPEDREAGRPQGWRNLGGRGAPKPPVYPRQSLASPSEQPTVNQIWHPQRAKQGLPRARRAHHLEPRELREAPKPDNRGRSWLQHKLQDLRMSSAKIPERCLSTLNRNHANRELH